MAGSSVASFSANETDPDIVEGDDIEPPTSPISQMGTTLEEPNIEIGEEIDLFFSSHDDIESTSQDEEVGQSQKKSSG